MLDVAKHVGFFFCTDDTPGRTKHALIEGLMGLLRQWLRFEAERVRARRRVGAIVWDIDDTLVELVRLPDGGVLERPIPSSIAACNYAKERLGLHTVILTARAKTPENETWTRATLAKCGVRYDELLMMDVHKHHEACAYKLAARRRLRARGLLLLAACDDLYPNLCSGLGAFLAQRRAEEGSAFRNDERCLCIKMPTAHDPA